jgi:hypothetical protein
LSSPYSLRSFVPSFLSSFLPLPLLTVLTLIPFHAHSSLSPYFVYVSFHSLAISLRVHSAKGATDSLYLTCSFFPFFGSCVSVCPSIYNRHSWNLPSFGTSEIRVLMCQEVSAIHDVVLFDSQQVSGSDYNPLESPSPSPAKSSFKSSSMNSLFGSLRSDRSLPINLTGSQTVHVRRTTKLVRNTSKERIHSAQPTQQIQQYRHPCLS